MTDTKLQMQEAQKTQKQDKCQYSILIHDFQAAENQRLSTERRYGEGQRRILTIEEQG